MYIFFSKQEARSVPKDRQGRSYSGTQMLEGVVSVRFEERRCDTVSYRVRKQIYGRSVL